MSQAPQFPQKEEGSTESAHNQESTNVIQPEFVLIDERNGKTKYSFFDADAQLKSHQTGPSTNKGRRLVGPTRLIFFLGSIFCILFGIILFILAIVITVLSAISFFQNSKINKDMRNSWKFFFATMISGGCLAIGVIIPALGIGLLSLFFAVASQDNFLRRFVQSKFTNKNS